jgi:PIN domain nuclease of toxin-antitoxin system
VKLLLDTHILLWAALDELGDDAEKYILDESNELFFSAASIWEVAIKASLGRDDFNVNPTALYQGLIISRYTEIPISSKHTFLVNTLKDIHKDPFDRILIAQAAQEGLSLITSDKVVADYSEAIILCR